jgi:uncharacterized SAM-binding protein YcdF (DUF218 family)
MMFKIIRKLFSLALAVIIAVPGYALFMTWKAAQPSDVVKADAIVVPGAAQLNGAPGVVLLARLEEAKSLFDKGFAPVIITVGSGAPGDRTTEAAAGRYWLRHHGIPKSSIIEIPTGRDTRSQTISYTQALRIRNLTSVIIATDAYHCGRTMAMARDNGISPQCSQVKSGPNSLENSRKKYLFREAGAYLAYITLGKFGINISDHLTNNASIGING